MKKLLSILVTLIFLSKPAISTGVNSMNSEIEFLGYVVFRTGYTFRDTEVGGLSGLAYNPPKGDYLCISDDKGLIGPARFYHLKIDLGDGHLDQDDVSFSRVVTLKQASGKIYPEKTLDPEGIAVLPGGNIFICSEGDLRRGTRPWVAEFSADGQFLRELPFPQKFVTSSDSTGFRDNANFEGLTLAPSGRFLFASVEHSLKEDGPLPDTKSSSLARVIKYDLRKNMAVFEYFYEIGRIVLESDETDLYGQNGLVELIAVDDFVLLLLERAYIPGVGNQVKLFRMDSRNATDVSHHYVGSGPFATSKDLILDLSSLGLRLDNFEGMAMGPELPDGRRTLILVSDNNFNESQRTLFFAFALGRTEEE